MEEQEIYVEEGTTISLKSLWAEIKHSICLIVIITLSLTVLGTLLGVFVVKTNYTSTATLYARPSDAGDLDMAERLAPIYASLLSKDSTIVYQRTAQKLNSPESGRREKITIQDLKDNLTVKVDNFNVNLKYVSKDEHSDVILDEIINSLKTEINSNLDVNVESGKKYPEIAGKLYTSSEPSEPTNDKYTKFIKYALIFFLLGILVSFITVLVKTVENEKAKAKTATAGTTNDTAEGTAGESGEVNL